MKTFIPSILFEDESILIVDKPAGMIVNRADTAQGVETLQDWIERKCQISFRPRSPQQGSGQAGQANGKCQISNEDFYKRSGIVHRLDKETSGLLIIAKTPESFENLQRQFKEGLVAKTYIALVHGKLEQEEGEINVPIGRLPWNRMRFGVLPAGRESKTLYKVLSIKYLVLSQGREPLSLVEVYPKSGRTHQIRVHFKYINHPLFGDELYAGRKVMKRDRKLLPRHFLHAAKISFDHPKTGKSIEFESPLPQELTSFLFTLYS